MLEAVDCINISTEKSYIYKYSSVDDDGDYNAFDYTACDEFATQPACTTMNLSVNVGKQVAVSDRNGIKVRRILKALAKFWGQKPPKYVQVRCASDYGLTKTPDKVTWGMTLGDRCGWAGWLRPQVQKDGSVELEADGFDS
jgi:hypothetical protein